MLAEIVIVRSRHMANREDYRATQSHMRNHRTMTIRFDQPIKGQPFPTHVPSMLLNLISDKNIACLKSGTGLSSLGLDGTATAPAIEPHSLANEKTRAGADSPDRNAQFEHINATCCTIAR